MLFDEPGLLAVNKPAGISLFADRHEPAQWWPLLQERFGVVLPVHRLDKGTSGVLLLARVPALQQHLNRLFLRGGVRKFYVARATGQLRLSGTGTIDLPLMKGRKSRYRIAGERAAIARQGDRWSLPGQPRPEGHASKTRLRVLATAPGYQRLLLRPLTGRTHQLRVHLAWIGHPLLGDHLYGRPGDPAQHWPRLALHCHRLVLPLPDGRVVSVVSPVPAAFCPT